MNKYLSCAKKASDWVYSKIDDSGTFGDEGNEIAAYYKAPTLFLLHGKQSTSHRLLDTIKNRFFFKDGDFRTSDELKSANPVFIEFYPYTNAWIVMAAQRLGRFEISIPGYDYLRKYFSKENSSFRTNLHDEESNSKCDILTAAHLGLASLYCGELTLARAAGTYLTEVFQKQEDLSQAFYLRTQNDKRLSTSFPEDQAPFYVIDPNQDNQLHFMIGYPIAFLSKLYLATGDKLFLSFAKQYLDFSMRCKGNVTSFLFSHKLAWGAATLSALTEDEKGMAFAIEIANNLISQQHPEGCWLKEENLSTQLDQTSEIAIWLTEISSILEISNQSHLVSI